jgi:hypothetical protein
VKQRKARHFKARQGKEKENKARQGRQMKQLMLEKVLQRAR